MIQLSSYRETLDFTHFTKILWLQIDNFVTLQKKCIVIYILIQPRDRFNVFELKERASTDGQQSAEPETWK